MPSNYDDEVYFCGRCRRQSEATPGEEVCPYCGKQTVSWYTNRESEETATKRWREVNND